jgi:hypothetical protein
MIKLIEYLWKVFSEIFIFSRLVGRPLRKYQLEPARAIIESVLRGKGLSFAVVMPRQAGKNELSAHLEAFLMNIYQRKGGFIVKAAPTYEPQLVNSIVRLQAVLDNVINRGRWEMVRGYVACLGKARCLFLSAHPQASVVGATASILLECDEAQEVEEDKWNKDFRPMGAAYNATTVYYGTTWTRETLLGKEMRRLRRQEEEDGVRRVFVVPWERVAEENAGYGEYVRGEIGRLGREHPLIRTQYFLEEIEAESGMFPESRVAQMKGRQERVRRRMEGTGEVALLIDVAGEGEEERGKVRDYTALTVVEVDASTVGDELIRAPTYRVLDRRTWRGVRHSTLYGTLVDLAREVWGARWVVIDATGVGAGLASFLEKALGRRVIPFRFDRRTKSELGWGFLAVCDTGRYKDYAEDGAEDTGLFWRQVRAAEYEVEEGAGKRMRWGVREREVHDDLLVSAALCAVLDGERAAWRPYGGSVSVPGRDPIEEMDEGRF